MQIVYKIIFTNRLKNGIKPYFYIGSKSNCSFLNGKMIDSRNKPYFGSPKWRGYSKIVDENSKNIKTEILFSSEKIEYKDLISKELELQIANDVVENPEYFNLAFAQQNSFSAPGFALYCHKDYPEKRVRLQTDNLKVKNGEYVHVNKGRKRDQKTVEKWLNDVARKTKSLDHRKKIGRRGLVMIKNAITGECKRVNKKDLFMYSKYDWFNPLTLAKSKLDCNGRPIKDIKINRKNKSCEINGKFYNSIESAAAGENVTRAVLKNRLNNNKWPDWKLHNKQTNENSKRN